MEKPWKASVPSSKRLMVEKPRYHDTTLGSASLRVAPSSEERKGSTRMFEPIMPQFFKFILEQNIGQGKLDFPTKFAREHGDLLSSPLTLEVPTGAKWRVKLLTQDGKIWLEEGWKEFADYYGLKPGHVLVFKQEGDSHFHVIIMGISTTEIDYPISRRCSTLKTDHCGGVLLEPKEEAMYEIDEILDDPSSLIGTREKATCSGVKLVKMDQMEEEIIDIFSDALPHYMEQKSNFRSGKPKQGIPAQKHKPKGRTASKKIASRALKASAKFTSDHPFFKLLVERDHLVYNCVPVPFDFVLRYFAVKKQNMVLEIGGEEWNVGFERYDYNRTGVLYIGWLPFAQANALKVGDVCAFDLVSPTVFKVTIFRGIGGQSS